MMRFILFILLLIWLLVSFIPQSNAQDLERKAWMGAQLREWPSPEASEGLEIGEAIGGTAVAIGVQAGDILLALDGSPVKRIYDLGAVLSANRAGNEVTAQINRNGEIIELKGKYQGKPHETTQGAETIYSSVAYKEGLLRTIITRPKKEGKLPAMLFIPGYTCSSVDVLPDNHPYKRIIEAYSKAGFVTYRVEKSGLGDSQNTPKCMECDLYDEIENFAVGLRALKALPYVDSTRIVVFGHSMGGVIAPAIAASDPVAGVVVYGTTAKSWYEYMLEMNRVQLMLAGIDPIEFEQSCRQQAELAHAYYIQKLPLEQIDQDTLLGALLRSHWGYDGKGHIFGRNAEYWRQIQDIDLLGFWQRSPGKVLVQFGESDFQAFSKADHEQIVYTVNHYSPAAATLVTFPETDHFFARIGSMKDAYDTFSKGLYEKLFDAYNPEVGNTAAAWSLDAVALPVAP